MIREFQYTEEDAAVFRREFADRIPDRIVDCHNHSWTKECLAIPREEYALHKQYKPWTDFDFMEEFTIPEFEQCAAAAFPGKTVRGMFFGLPFPQVDRVRSKFNPGDLVRHPLFGSGKVLTALRRRHGGE